MSSRWTLSWELRERTCTVENLREDTARFLFDHAIVPLLEMRGGWGFMFRNGEVSAMTWFPGPEGIEGVERGQ